MSEFTARIKAVLDDSQIQSQLAAIGNKPITLTNVKVNPGAITSQIQSALNSGSYTINIGKINLSGADKSLTNIGNNAGRTIADGISNNIGGAINRSFNSRNSRNSIESSTQIFRDLQSTIQDVGKLEFKIRGLDESKNSNQITELNRQLDELVARRDALAQSMMSDPGQYTAGQFSQLNDTTLQAQNRLSELDAKLADVKARMAEQIQIKMDSGAMDASIASLASQYERLSTTGHAGLSEVANDLNQLRELQTELGESKSSDQMIATYQRFQQVLDKTKNQLSQINSETKNLASATANAAFTRDAQKWLEDNPKAYKNYGAQVEALIAKNQEMGASGTQTKQQLQDLKTEFLGIQTAAAAAGETGITFGQALKNSFMNITGIYSMTSLVRNGIRYFKQMANEVIAVDKSMTGLKRVTSLSDDQYKTMYSNMVSSAKQYGATLTDIINGTTDWVKLGFSPEIAQQLSNVTAMYQHVTDLDNATATKNLVTAYKGFEKSLLEANNGDQVASMMQIADIYDKLGNEFAESAGDVGEGLSKAAAVLQEGGASIQESAGMFTGMQEVLQDASVAGSTLKIYTLRMRGMKGQLEELGEEVDSNVDSISKMQTQVLNLTHGKVNIFDDQGNFRDIYDITKDIADVFYTLSDPERAELLELVAGKNRSAGIAAMLQNWSQVEKATNAAYNSTGTAIKEQETYINSLEGKINAFKTSWSAFSNSLISSDFLKGAVDFGTSFVSTLDSIISKLGSVPTILASIAGAMSFTKGAG